MFSRGGTLLPSIYADARYIDAVIVSRRLDPAPSVGDDGVTRLKLLYNRKEHLEGMNPKSLLLCYCKKQKQPPPAYKCSQTVMKKFVVGENPFFYCCCCIVQCALRTCARGLAWGVPVSRGHFGRWRGGRVVTARGPAGGAGGGCSRYATCAILCHPVSPPLFFLLLI